MNQAPGNDTKRRRLWTRGAVAVYLVIILVVAWGLSAFYRGARDHLDDALGQRMLAVAVSLAVTIDAEAVFNYSLGDSTARETMVRLQERFEDLGSRLDLAEITLSDPDGRILLTTSGALEPGGWNDFWAMDQQAVDAARRGTGAASRLYRLQGAYLKSAHAPVILHVPGADGDFVAAIVTVSGSPDFFDSLSRLRRAAWATGAVVLACLVVLAILLYRIQAALERSRAAMLRQENLAAMGRMTAGIAHEIRNPLGIIRGAGQYLQEQLQERGLDTSIAAFIPEEVDRLDRILSRYLSFGANEAAEPEVFAPGPVVADAVKLLQDECRDRGIRLEVEPLPDVRTEGDPLRLRQVVMNLVLNARDVVDNGGSITISGEADASELKIRVRDNGPGLPPGDPEELFQPFHSLKEKGSGLGLALSRAIAEEMGGSLILADRKDGRGAEAVLTLPLAAGDRTTAKEDSHGSRPGGR